MRRMPRFLLLVPLLAVQFLPLVSYGADEIRVGVINAYSCAPSRLAEDVLDGFTLAIEKINSEGGVLGRKVVPVTPVKKGESGLAEAQSLVGGAKADILLATLDNASAFDVAALAAEKKVPLFVAFTERPLAGTKEASRYVFDVGESPRMAGVAAAVMLHEKPYENYWIAGDDDDYGHTLADGLWNALKMLEPTFQLVGQSWWKPGETEFGPSIAKILAAQPDFVIAATGPSNIAPFQKAAKAAGLAGKIPFYQNWASEHSLLAEQGSDALEGVYGTTSYLFYSPATPANKAFVEEFRREYFRNPGSGAFYGFMAARFIAEGFRKAGTFDTEKLISSLEGMKLDSPVGSVIMRPCDHQLALPIFLSLTGKVAAYRDFLASQSLQSLSAGYYMGSCGQPPKAEKH